MVADWQLPPGVDRSLWDYFHDPDLARSYDQQLVDSHLLRIDQRFVSAHFTPPGRLLDLGCGTGRLLIEQAKRGLSCVGVDLSAEMLKVAAAKSHAENVSVSLVQANMVELTCFDANVFDYVACLFSTLGMVLGRTNRQRVVEHVYRILRPGGKFVLHVHNRWFNLRHPQMRRWLARDLLLSLIGRGGDHVMPPHAGLGAITLHLFTRREATSLLRRAGFRVAEVVPLALNQDGTLALPGLFGNLRAYGYLLLAVK